MRGTVIRGFCKGVGDYAVVGDPVELPDAFFLEMERLGSVKRLDPEVAPVESAPEQPESKPPAKHRKGA